jgi:predicted metal-dependent hydrolase
MAATTMRELLEQGRAAFNSGAYHLAHELWEDAWHQLAGAERLRIQGLIQIAAGLHHLQAGRSRPAAALLGKGLEKLERTAETRAVDVPADLHLATAQLGREVAGFLAALEIPGTTPPDPTVLRI